jgi:NTE family protein
LYSDLERLTQINQIVSRLGAVNCEGAQLRRIDLLVILPSRDLSEIARHHVDTLPRTLRVLLRTMGALNASGGQLMSYLLFQDSYTRELIALGYQDAMKRSEDLLAFLGGLTVETTGATGTLRRLSLRKEERAESQ